MTENEFKKMTETNKWTHTDSKKVGPFNREWSHLWTSPDGDHHEATMELDGSVSLRKVDFVKYPE